MRIVMLLLFIFLIGCGSNKTKLPETKRYIGNVQDDDGNILDDSVYIEASKDTLYLRVYKDGSFDRPKLPLEQGKSVEPATDADFTMFYNTQITGSWEGQKRYLLEDRGTSYKKRKVTPTLEATDVASQNSETDLQQRETEFLYSENSERQNAVQQSNHTQPAEEKYYYKVTWSPNEGAKAEKCKKADNSIGETCSEIGSLRAYRDAKGAILWDKGYSLGAIVWTDKKVIYQGYEGSDHGTRDFMIVNDESESIQYCQPKGSSLLIVTNKQTYTRN